MSALFHYGEINLAFKWIETLSMLLWFIFIFTQTEDITRARLSWDYNTLSLVNLFPSQVIVYDVDNDILAPYTIIGECVTEMSKYTKKNNS